jgi:hypothetical protein
VRDLRAVQGLEAVSEPVRTEVEGVVVRHAHHVDADGSDLPDELHRRPEVVERPLGLRVLVHRELEVAVRDVGLLHEPEQLLVIGLWEVADLFVEDPHRDRTNDVSIEAACRKNNDAFVAAELKLNSKLWGSKRWGSDLQLAVD